jgi:hypothetical protein
MFGSKDLCSDFHSFIIEDFFGLFDGFAVVLGSHFDEMMVE